MRRTLIAVALVAGLAGCNQNPDVATPNQVVIALNAYNTAAATGTAYLNLPLCGSPPCRELAMSQNVYTALKSARAARTQLLAALKANQSAPITAIQALQAAGAVIQQIPLQK